MYDTRHDCTWTADDLQANFRIVHCTFRLDISFETTSSSVITVFETLWLCVSVYIHHQTTIVFGKLLVDAAHAVWPEF